MAKRILSKLTIFFVLNLSAWLMVIPGHASATKKQVLILNSYSQGTLWTDNVMQGMLSVSNNSCMDLEIHVEYMDTKRHPPKESFPYLENFYHQKYGQTHFDLNKEGKTNGNWKGSYTCLRRKGVWAFSF